MARFSCVLSGRRRVVFEHSPVAFQFRFRVRVKKISCFLRPEHFPMFGNAFVGALIFYAAGNLFPRTWNFYRKRRFANGLTRAGRQAC